MSSITYKIATCEDNTQKVAEMENQLVKETKPVIVGIKSTSLTEQEKDFLVRYKPWGIILFHRNIDTTDQLKALTSEINGLLPYEPMIAIDLESGLVVNRLKFLDILQEHRKGPNRQYNPEYQKWLDHGKLGQKYEEAKDENAKNDIKELVYRTYYEIGSRLKNFGININLAPVLDLSCKAMQCGEENRAFSRNTQTVIDLGKPAAKGLIDAGILPALKHAPGLGTSESVDSHNNTPIVSKDKIDIQTLLNQHLRPFVEITEYIKSLGKMPIVMSGHIIYECLDDKWTIPFSQKALSFLKEHLAAETRLLTDDLSMGGATKCPGFLLNSTEEVTLPKILKQAVIASGEAKMKQIYLCCHELSGGKQDIERLKEAIELLQGESFIGKSYSNTV